MGAVPGAAGARMGENGKMHGRASVSRMLRLCGRAGALAQGRQAPCVSAWAPSTSSTKRRAQRWHRGAAADLRVHTRAEAAAHGGAGQLPWGLCLQGKRHRWGGGATDPGHAWMHGCMWAHVVITMRLITSPSPTAFIQIAPSPCRYPSFCLHTQNLQHLHMQIHINPHTHAPTHARARTHTLLACSAG